MFKKLILLSAVLIGLLFLADFVYKTYRQNSRETSISNDRAVLFVYLDLDSEDIEEYFNLSEEQKLGLSDNLSVRCVAPGYEHLNLINNKKFTKESDINCTTEFNFATQLEMKKAYQKPGYAIKVILKERNKRTPLASKIINVPWIYGKVNHIIVNEKKAYNFCSN